MSTWDDYRNALMQSEDARTKLQQALYVIANEMGLQKGAKVKLQGEEYLVFSYDWFYGEKLWLQLTKPTKTGAMPKKQIQGNSCSSDAVVKVQ